MPVFIPSNGDPLVVRSTLGIVPENSSRNHHMPQTRKDFAGNRPATMASARFGNLSQSAFFARHNPHPGRVRHIKGLLDIPICSVHDEGYVLNPRLQMRRPATGTLADQTMPHAARLPVASINYHPNHINPPLQTHRINHIEAKTQYRRFPLSMRERADPRFGLIPMIDMWREELCQLTEAAGLGLPKEIKEQQEAQPKRTSIYSADTGRLIPPPSRAMSRGFSRQKQRPRELFHHIAPDVDREGLVMEMLCQILQTDSINAVQSWLCSSGQREKDLVLDMIRSAVANEEDYWQRNQSQNYYDMAAQERPHSHPPPTMMNLQNGYGELDRPDPTLGLTDDGVQKRTGAPIGYSRYSYEQEVDRRMAGSTDKAKLQDIHGSRQRSSKVDILRIEHDQRPASQAKPQTPKLRYISTPKEGQSANPHTVTE